MPTIHVEKSDTAEDIARKIRATEPRKSPQFTAAQIARVCHEANRVIQIETLDPVVSPAWGIAPSWIRESAIEGVEKALEGATPEQLHESWCEFKRNGGWVYGEVKDPEAMTHPCLVPYAELPAEQKVKDTLFSAIVAALS